MNLEWTAIGAIAALPAATVLRGRVVSLSVRAGEVDETACGACAAPLPARSALRCWLCGVWLGRPAAIEVIAALVAGLLFARFGAHPAVAAFAYLGVIGVALAEIDLAVQRLPDQLTLPSYPAMILLLGLTAIATDDGAGLTRALLGGLALGGGYLVLGIVSVGQLGGGDIKLAGLVGLALGWVGWRTFLTGACLGFVLAALAGLCLLVTGRISRRDRIAFGPFMLLGALVAILLVT
jgi:leader peptidase (prepilin peptidase) / N-methyltransferase